MTRIVNESHSLPASDFPAEADAHLLNLKGRKAELV